MADAKITALANNTTIDDADLVAIVDDVAGTPTTEKRTVAELKAHIVNTTTVTAAGALMDSEVTNLAQVKAFDSSDYATAAQGSTADTAVQPASTDTLTNKTIDVDNNTISNIETDNIAAATLVTEADAILSNDNDTTLPTSAAVRDLQDDTHNDFQMYGFLNQDETTLAFNDSTYVFTLGDAGAGWSYYRQGVKITISGDKTVTLAGSPPTAATYFIFIDDDSGTLTASTTPWTLADTKVPVALIEWNDSNTPKYIIGEERHSARIPRHVHKYLHSTQGTQFESGGVIAGYTVDGSSDAENTFSITETKIWDEDIQNTCAVFADPDGATDAYHIAFRTAADTWSWELSEVPFRYTAAGYIQYDSGGTMTQGQATEYYNTYLLATNYKGAARFVIIHGQSEFASLSAAQAEQFSDLTLTGFPAEEAIALWQLTWQTSNSYAMKGKARLAAEPVKVTTNITAASSAPGLGTISTQNADDVSITGGTITGITDLAVADGGTGASDAAGAKTNLGFITDLVDDTTPQQGGDLAVGEQSIELDTTLSGDEKWSGITVAGTLGATTTTGDIVFLQSDGKWDPVDGIVDGTDTGFNKQLGICLDGGNDTDTTEILLYGKVRSAAFPAFTVGSPVYVSDTEGEVTVTKPSTSNHTVRIVGYALSAEELMFNPSNDWTINV